MPTPLISAIIPTYGRPRFLQRAIGSALEGWTDEIEVIVVPNGPDNSWRNTLAPFAQDSRVRVSIVSPANANLARNHGASLARGKYIRFLDDDDFIYAEAVREQLTMLEQTGADVCSGSMDVLYEGIDTKQCVTQPDTEDFTTAILMPERLTNPPAHIFRRDILPDTPWTSTTPARQDIEFMIRLVGTRELSWCRLSRSVGAWVQHASPRVSQPFTRNSDHVRMYGWLMEAHQALSVQGRLTFDRQLAIANALADSAHKAFPFAPFHWSRVLAESKAMNASARPRARILDVDIFSGGNIIATEWALCIPRWLAISFRRTKARLGYASWKRSI
ncbi:glycosyltransferase family 2 protein [Dyella sp. ASV21]|uniref:glycosyltransferase family 2 protein n=1 Tax=Dyella sp. ASV21 TaxID=2795114 RepID=UPI0018EDAB89|nr:glycosyltransferase family 2 protein [Dyella sp. ASV21]